MGDLVWSSEVGQAGWIGQRLAPCESHLIASVVPDGLEAYARVLHPAEDPFTGDRPVRRAAVAARCGMPLHRGAQFHSVALPAVRPAGEAPLSGQGPRQGTLHLPDAQLLAGSVDGHARAVLVLPVGRLRLGQHPADDRARRTARRGAA